ncbi:hypothetical protein P7C73_g1877, partial [Tremellales sp. Uapishka_1]
MMPRVTKSRPPVRASATARSKARSRRKASPTPSPSPDIEPKVESATVLLSKPLVLKIVLAKLEASQTCDWFKLSEVLNQGAAVFRAEGGETGGKSSGRGKRKNKSKDGEKEYTGMELHELYHNQILPALKSGKALWNEDSPFPTLADQVASATETSSPQASTSVKRLPATGTLPAPSPTAITHPTSSPYPPTPLIGSPGRTSSLPTSSPLKSAPAALFSPSSSNPQTPIVSARKHTPASKKPVKRVYASRSARKKTARREPEMVDTEDEVEEEEGGATETVYEEED